MNRFVKGLQKLQVTTTSAINTPVRLTIVSFLLSELLTGVLTWLIYGSFSLPAFAIAGICSTAIPYVVSSRLVEQQRIIQEKNLELQQFADRLRVTNSELSERNAQLDAFSHTVAHDLQSPLSALNGLSRLLEENYTKVSAETVRQHLLMIRHTSAKMSQIVDELLLLSQIRELDTVNCRPLDMEKIVGEVTKYLALLVDEYGGHIVVPDKWPTAVGYAPWVEQVWTNYISNALKYGGRPPLVTLGANVQGKLIRFWVRDNGPGLTPRDQAKLFIPHRRLDETRASGHGLGLSIVRNIIERLGGEVGVQSRGVTGEGCCFYFTLPGGPLRDYRRLPSVPLPESAAVVTPRDRAKDLAVL